MLVSPANRPLIIFRWIAYATLLALFLVLPYLLTSQSHPPITTSLWLSGAYAVFLCLYSMTELRRTRGLSFQRLGLALGELSLAVTFVMSFRELGTASTPLVLLAVALVSFEHGFKYGAIASVLSSLFLCWQSEDPLKLLGLVALSTLVPFLEWSLRSSREIERELPGDSQANSIDRAYEIARRENRKRQDNEDQLLQQKRRVEGLVNVAQELAEERDQEKLLHRVAEAASDQLRAEGVAVFVLDQGRLEAQASTGLSVTMVESLASCLSPQLLQGMADSRWQFNFGSHSSQPSPEEARLLQPFDRLLDPAARRKPGEERIRQMLLVPISSAQDDSPLGVVLAINQNLDKDFSTGEYNHLKVLATNSGIALRNILFTAQLERSHWELIQALAQAIEAKDSYTSNHVGRVRDLSVEIAQAIGLNNRQIKVLAIAATLHDVGKISTPDAVLMKPGPLSEEEYEIMKQHAPNGAQILRGIHSLPPGVEEMVRHHHERWDGKGYPDGRAGKDIPLGAQIISIADCFDAMTYDRPYRKGFARNEALRKMEMGCGSQFNPKLLCAFFALQGYVPRTEPSAIETYNSILGKLKLGAANKLSPVKSPPATGASAARPEQSTKPLLMERN